MSGYFQEVRLNEAYFITLLKNLYNLTNFKQVNRDEFNNYAANNGSYNKQYTIFYKAKTEDSGGSRLLVPRRRLHSLTQTPLLSKVSRNIPEEELKLLIELNDALPDKNLNSISYVYILDRSEPSFKLYNKSITFESRDFFKRCITKHMNQFEFYNFVQKAGLSEIPGNGEQAYFRKRYTERTDIVKWCDVTYVDIHKAHASELIKMFAGTGVDKEILEMVERGETAKKNGDLKLAKFCKDVINLAVGSFKMNRKWLYDVDTTPLFNRIVHNIYLKEMQQLNKMKPKLSDATLIYAQTDSLMVNHSKCTADSTAIGEYGIEFQGTVYTYFQKDGEHTGYTVFQYRDKDGKLVTKGDLPDKLKPYIDLPNGIVVFYKKKLIGNTGMFDCSDYIIKEMNIHEEK